MSLEGLLQGLLHHDVGRFRFQTSRSRHNDRRLFYTYNDIFPQFLAYVRASVLEVDESCSLQSTCT